MKKSFIIPFIIFAILAGGLYYLLTNAHVDLFSGTNTRFDNFELKEYKEEGSVSLLAVQRGDAELDAAGWAMAIGVIAGIPAIIALMVRGRIRRKARKRAAIMMQAQPTHEVNA